MSATAALTMKTVPGADTLAGINITPDNSYPAGGYTIPTANQSLGYGSGANLTTSLGINLVRRIISIRADNFAAATYIPNLVPTYGVAGAITSLQLRLVVCNTGAEVATGTDVSGLKFHMLLEGA